jgi:hypothetical protein
VEDRIAVFHAMRASPRTLAVFNTGGHSIFTDRTTLSGPEIASRIKGATRELSTLFLQQELPKAGRMTSVDGDGATATALQAPSEAQLTRDGSQGMGQWLLRHQDLLDRFVMPGGAAGQATGRVADRGTSSGSRHPAWTGATGAEPAPIDPK